MGRQPAKLKVTLEIVRVLDPRYPCFLVSRGNKGLSGESEVEEIEARKGGG
jgi:hypothetical protein